ncbi:hypothetical protein [Rhabdochromatium marinum]|uniref:hypothetical protein n=1 Tax=Rhabdochromatium marinum TaxID=48729 RepID=UPI0019037B7C|nr:hypothetical protein [Rhabdochromatium marinum]MBK1649757.1 hypothetical protein [Rhabdochromatium marinum]
MAQTTDAACTATRDRLADLREGLEAPSQSRTSRLLRAGSLRLIKGDRDEQEPLLDSLSELQSSNRTRNAAAQRLREAEALGEQLWPEAEMLLAQQARDRRGLPERAAQATRLDQLKACITELLTAYQLTLADAYAAGQRAADESTLQLSALRILEWTWREHELHRLRYQPIPAASWQRANRVFFALLSAGWPDEPLGVCAAPDFLTNAEGGCTRQALYLNLQVQGLFDLFSWPKTTQGFVARYCALVPQAVQLSSSLASSDSATTYCRYLHPNHDGPPGVTPPTGSTEVLQLDYNVLAAAIRADHHVFFRRDPGGTRSPERLLALPSFARRPSIRLLARDMDNGAVDMRMASAPDATETLYLSAGMATIRALLHQVFSRTPHSHSPQTVPRTRRHPLQQPSHLRTNGDSWHLVNRSARLWRIQNPSTQSSTALSVGTLVAFGVGKPGLARPKLARVARILRTSRVLQIDLQELASFAAPVSVTPVTDDGLLNSSLRAFLVYDDDFGWGLVTPPQQQFHEGDAITIRAKRMLIQSKLRSLREATQDFLLFQINPHDPQLGVPSYPRAHKAGRRSGKHRNLTPSPADSRNPAESEYRPLRF